MWDFQKVMLYRKDRSIIFLIKVVDLVLNACCYYSRFTKIITKFPKFDLCCLLFVQVIQFFYEL